MSQDDNPAEPYSPTPPPKKMEGHYTQINVLFPSSQVELPSAEKFKAFPPEAQKAILAAFEREQTERHTWLKNQQSNEQALNLQSGRHYYRWRMFGTFCGTLVVISALSIGGWLVAHGSSATGIFVMLVTAGGMVSAAVWGRASSRQSSDTSQQQSESQRQSN